MSSVLILFITRLLVFGCLISITSCFTRYRCGGFESAARHVPLRPPGWVFGAVWSLLFVTTGVAWANTSTGELDAGLSVVTVLCCAWLAVYSCLKWKKVAAGVLLATTLLTATLVKENWLLLPLALWTAFASYLNVYDAFLKCKR